MARATEEWGTFVGVPHEHEVGLAERLTEIIPCAEMAALCGGGGSDAPVPQRTHRPGGYRREKVIKVEAGYHGWHDDLAVSTAAPHPTTTSSACRSRNRSPPAAFTAPRMRWWS